MIRVFHGPDFLTLKISKAFYLFVCCHDAEPLVCIAQKLIAGVIVDLLHELHKLWIVHMLTHLINIVKKCGHIKYCGILHESDLRCSVLHYKWDISILAGLKQLSVSTEHTVRIHTDFHLAIA